MNTFRNIWISLIRFPHKLQMKWKLRRYLSTLNPVQQQWANDLHNRLVGSKNQDEATLILCQEAEKLRETLAALLDKIDKTHKKR